MTQTGVQTATTTNRLLAALPITEYERVLPAFDEVVLKFNSIIYARGDKIRHVYFPISGRRPCFCEGSRTSGGENSKFALGRALRAA